MQDDFLKSVPRVAEPARPALVIVPKYLRNGPGALIEPRSKPETFKELADSAYNFSLFGRRGFEAIAPLVDRGARSDVRVSNLGEAIAACDTAAREVEP